MYGATLRGARTDRGLTQGELAAASGIAQANISAIENGRRQPSAETLHRLLAACGYDLVAVAGDGRLTLVPPPAPGEPEIVADLLAERDRADPIDPFESPSPIGPDTPVELRARLLVAVLDASEATIRGRLR